MTLDMYRQSVGKIPALVGQMAAWESEKDDGGIWTETVEEHWKSGTRKSRRKKCRNLQRNERWKQAMS